MDQLNLLFRSFKNLRDALLGDQDCADLCDAIIHSEKQEKIVYYKTVCTIEEDWIDAIEKGLIYIGKAIDEDRQFIRSNGEIELIEKVKRVSRESVEHLARHSEMISKKKGNEEIMPEKLYTVERLNDHTIYENRFLYMLLCLLKDFISLRYNKLVKLTDTYKGELKLHKTVSFGKHKLNYEVRLKDERENDDYIRKINGVSQILDRLESMQRLVSYYLKTPLMVEVAKADKIRTKVTKTNILLMDKNFKETLALYEFLLSYDKDGYRVVSEEHELHPIKEDVAADFALQAIISAFLTYEHGLGLEEELKANYEEEEKRREEEQKRYIAEQIKNLKNRIKASGMGAEEYMLLLEKRNAALEKDSEDLITAKNEIASLNGQIESLNNEIATQKIEFDKQKADYEEQIISCNLQIEEEKKKLADEVAAHDEAIVRLEKNKRDEIALAKKDFQQKIDLSNALIEEKDAAIGNYLKQIDEVKQAKLISDARLNGMRSINGLMTEVDDFTSEEAFNELESQFEALGKLVRIQWKGTKKMLRQEYFREIKNAVFAKKSKKTVSNSIGSSDPDDTSKGGNTD